MTWVVGQIVGTISGTFDKRAHRGVVTEVTKSGRAKVTFTRAADGGTFTGTYGENGRPIPYSRSGKYLHVWDPEMEVMYNKQLEVAASRRAMVQQQRAEADQERKDTRDAANYLLELLEGKNDPRVDKAREFIQKSVRNYEDFT